MQKSKRIQQLKHIASIRVGLQVNRKKGNTHDDSFFRYQVLTHKAFSSIGVVFPDETDEFIASKEIPEQYITQEGDVLVRLREPNIAVYVDEKGSGLVVPSLMAIIKVRDEYVSGHVFGRYLAQCMNSKFVQHQLRKSIKGTTIPMVTSNDLADMEIVIPSLERQEHIVALMALANEEITLLGELYNIKQQFRKELLDTIVKKEKEYAN